jgi:uncharacterized protein (TIGR02145 family)
MIYFINLNLLVVKTIINSARRTCWFKASIAIIICLSFLILPSCQKNEFEQDSMLIKDNLLPALSKKDKIEYGKVRDVEGNVYKTVQIGGQLWMAENLNTTHYNNGEEILTTERIVGEDTPRYQWSYDTKQKNAAIYGRLYTWYAVTDSRGVCPIDWHVPTNAEWTTLTDYLINNGYGYGGDGDDIAKSMASTKRWNTDPTAGNVGNDQASNNSSGFTALPGGSRYLGQDFVSLGDAGSWWASTENTGDLRMAYWLDIHNSLSNVQHNDYYKWFGFSVRCVKD